MNARFNAFPSSINVFVTSAKLVLPRAKSVRLQHTKNETKNETILFFCVCATGEHFWYRGRTSFIWKVIYKPQKEWLLRKKFL